MSEAVNGVFDIEASVERAGDKEFWAELMGAYLQETTRGLRGMVRALEDSDRETLEREAHTIKGGSAELLVESMRELAYELEQLARSGQLEGIAPLLRRIEAEFRAVQDFTSQHLAPVSAG